MKHYLVVIICMLSLGAGAQQPLSLQEAINIALAHNFDIRWAEANVRQAEVNNTIGNAGMLPNVSLDASYSMSRSNTLLQLSNGTAQENPNAANTGLNVGLGLNWVVFDGGRMFLVKRQLNLFEEMSEYQYRAQVQQIVSRVVRTYAQSVLQKQQLLAIDTGLVLARTRMNIAQLKFETGASAKVDYLQARVDYNGRRSDSLYAVAELVTSFDSLNVLMGMEEGMLYIVEDSLDLNIGLEPVNKELLFDVNPTLQTFRQNVQISLLDKKIAQSYRLPQIAINGGYDYTRNTSATGFALFNRGYGPNGLVTLSVPIFNGGNINRQIKSAGLEALKDQLVYEKQETVLGKQYRTAWRNFRIAVAAYRLQQENLVFARENMEVQLARFRVGIGTTLEARQAENDYVNALVNYFTAAYEVKVNETIVLELDNRLVEAGR